MALKLFLISLLFSKISVECTLHSEAPPCLDTTQTTFSESNTYQRGNIGENKKFIPENTSFQGYFTEISFDTLEGNHLSFFQIFSK